MLLKTDLDVSVFGVDEGLNEKIGLAGKVALLDSAAVSEAPPPKVLEFLNGEVWELLKAGDIVPKLVALFVFEFPPNAVGVPKDGVDEDGAFVTVPKVDVPPNPPKVDLGISAVGFVSVLVIELLPCTFPNGDELVPVEPKPPKVFEGSPVNCAEVDA